MDKTTRIANRDVPMEPGEVSTVQFSAGRAGAEEAGVWEFWTAFSSGAAVTARCRQGSDPGERFRRMEGAKGYEKYWSIAATAVALRPATQKEVVSWLNDHRSDAVFAGSCQVGGRTMRAVRRTDGFVLE